jgi:trehalose-6-phosphate synthase
MPDDERGRHAEALKQTVMKNDIAEWVEAQLKDIATHPKWRGQGFG